MNVKVNVFESSLGSTFLACRDKNGEYIPVVADYEVLADFSQGRICDETREYTLPEGEYFKVSKNDGEVVQVVPVTE